MCRRRERYVRLDPALRELYADPRARMATADELVETMNEDGIDTSVVMGIGWTDHGVAREVNDYIIESVRDHPNRIAGLAGVNPAWGLQAALEADRCARAGLQGVGEMHPDLQRFDLGDERTMRPLMEVMQEHRLILMTHSSEPVGHLYRGKGHTGPEVLWRFVRTAREYPGVTVVCGHWGGGLPFFALMPEVGEALANIYFDTAASPFLYKPQVFPVVAGLVGANRILLGSDYPLVRPRRLLQQVRRSPLSEADKQAIIGGNAAEVLRR